MLKVYLFKASIVIGGRNVLREIMLFGPDNATDVIPVCAPVIIAIPPPNASAHLSMRKKGSL